MRWARAAVLAGAALAGTTGIAVLAGGAAASQVTASMAGTQSAVTAQVSPPAGHWGDAHQVDLSALQPGNGPIGIDALSCASPGNCSAGGHYTDSAQHRQAFVVTEDYVRTRLLDSKSGEPGKDEKIQLNDVEHVFKAWVLTFRTNNEWWKDIVRRDQEAQRKLRADERQTLGSHIVIGLAFLLLAGYGYVRLDEYTQRRYTTWLRVAGIGVAATVIAGWWWVYFQAPTAPMVPG